MLFVDVHCEDEIDRHVYIPLHKVDEIHTNADGDDYIVVAEKVYIVRDVNGIWASLVEFNEITYDEEG